MKRGIITMILQKVIFFIKKSIVHIALILSVENIVFYHPILNFYNVYQIYNIE
jgi:hypothetical protein